MDHKLTQKVQQWLLSPASERNIEAGATLLLQLNRNRVLYASILRNPAKMHAKLEYELTKHLRIRLDGYTLQEIVQMERTVIPSAKESILRAPSATEEQGKYRGRRADHDTLPEDIQHLYVRNGDIFAKLKNTYETLKTMENRPPCDRYEYLKVLKELDDEYRANWNKYDHYDGASSPAEEVAPSAKNVSAARKYLSTNKEALAAAIEAEDAKRIETLRDKMQQRIAIILKAGETFDAEYQNRLETLGLSFD